jgi:hypothetical protein
MALRKYKRKKGVSISKAKKHTFKGVDYKSGLEFYMAKVLWENAIDFKYESTKFILQEGFRFDQDIYERQANGKGDYKERGNKKVLPLTYTPDFIGDDFIIETKGFAGEAFPIRWKIFRYLMKDREDIILYKPQNRKDCDATIELIKQYRNND